MTELLEGAACVPSVGEGELSEALHAFCRYEANMRTHAISRPNQLAEMNVEGEGDHKTGQDVEEEVYKVASTGAQVTLASAKPLLYTFCAKLASDKCVAVCCLPRAAFT